MLVWFYFAVLIYILWFVWFCCLCCRGWFAGCYLWVVGLSALLACLICGLCGLCLGWFCDFAVFLFCFLGLLCGLVLLPRFVLSLLLRLLCGCVTLCVWFVGCCAIAFRNFVCVEFAYL